MPRREGLGLDVALGHQSPREATDGLLRTESHRVCVSVERTMAKAAQDQGQLQREGCV